jgi:hypothetical protein
VSEYATLFKIITALQRQKLFRPHAAALASNASLQGRLLPMLAQALLHAGVVLQLPPERRPRFFKLKMSLYGLSGAYAAGAFQRVLYRALTGRSAGAPPWRLLQCAAQLLAAAPAAAKEENISGQEYSELMASLLRLLGTLSSVIAPDTSAVPQDKRVALAGVLLQAVQQLSLAWQLATAGVPAAGGWDGGGSGGLFAAEALRDAAHSFLSLFHSLAGSQVPEPDGSPFGAIVRYYQLARWQSTDAAALRSAALTLMRWLPGLAALVVNPGPPAPLLAPPREAIGDEKYQDMGSFAAASAFCLLWASCERTLVESSHDFIDVGGGCAARDVDRAAQLWQAHTALCRLLHWHLSDEALRMKTPAAAWLLALEEADSGLALLAARGDDERVRRWVATGTPLRSFAA